MTPTTSQNPVAARSPLPETVRISGRRLPELDGVRGVAILLVLFFHFGVFRTEIPGQRLLQVVFGMSPGWMGVDLFLVLSGFLITGILLEAKDSPHYFRSFYMRRVVRIFPLYFAAVFGAFAIGLPLEKAAGMGDGATWGESLWYWSYLSNWRSGLGHDIQPITHFWSLAVEEQFYLIWPFVVLLFPERRLRVLCVGIAGAALAGRFMLADHLPAEALYRLTPFRMDSLALGALAVMAARDARLQARVRQLLPLLAVIAAAGVVTIGVAEGRASAYTPWMSTLGYSAIGLFCATLVFGVAIRTGGEGSLERVFRQPVLRMFGKYSYGLYVLHYPIASALKLGLRQMCAGFGVTYDIRVALVSVVAGIALSLPVAMLSWRWLEEPCLRLRSRFPY